MDEDEARKSPDDTESNDQPAAAEPLVGATEGEAKKNVEPTMDNLQDWFSSSTSGWLKSAKEMTFTTLELVKKDLNELSDAFASEATALANSTVESVKQQAQTLQHMIISDEVTPVDESATETIATGAQGWTPKLPSLSSVQNNSWMKTLVDTVKNLAQEDTTVDEDEFTEAIPPAAAATTRRTQLPHFTLYEIQTNVDTYLTMTEIDQQLFEIWREKFKLQEHDREINELLANCPPIRGFLQKLVPSETDYITFWERYFFKIEQAELVADCEMHTSQDGLESIDSKNASTEESGADSHSDQSVNTVGQISPDAKSNTDESWSVCSSTNADLQEAHENELPKENEKSGLQTPKADEWINWED